MYNINSSCSTSKLDILAKMDLNGKDHIFLIEFLSSSSSPLLSSSSSSKPYVPNKLDQATRTLYFHSMWINQSPLQVTFFTSHLIVSNQFSFVFPSLYIWVSFLTTILFYFFSSVDNSYMQKIIKQINNDTYTSKETP